MSSEIQTILALTLVAVAAAWLLRGWLAKKKSSGCEGNCSAVSPEIKKLRSRMK